MGGLERSESDACIKSLLTLALVLAASTVRQGLASAFSSGYEKKFHLISPAVSLQQSSDEPIHMQLFESHARRTARSVSECGFNL